MLSTDSLSAKLLRFYAGAPDSNVALNTMKGALYDNFDSKDYRMRWLTQLVLLARQKDEKDKVGEKSEGITLAAFTDLTSHYVYQLLGEQRYVAAARAC